MPVIKPISDLRNKFNEIADICHKEGEPVFITKNGTGDLVVMSIARYEQNEALLDVYRKLSVAEQQALDSGGRISHEAMMARLRARLHDT